MSIVERMRRSMRRTCIAPIGLLDLGSVNEAPAAQSLAPQKWEERASAFYLGWSEYKEFRRQALWEDAGPDWRSFWGVPVFEVVGDSHFSVTWERR